jgi:hypothetical protein
MPVPIRLVVAGVFGLVAVACESSKFQPAVFSGRESATRAATVYSLETTSGAVGRALVWSPGMYKEASRPVVDVRVDLQNQTNDPMRFDTDHVTLAVTEKNGTAELARAFRIVGLTTVPPKSHVEIKALTSLPRGVKPDDVSAYDFKWTVHTDKGNFGDSTAFVQQGPSSGCCDQPRALYPVGTNAGEGRDPALPLSEPSR